MNENLVNQIAAALVQDGTIKMTGEAIATDIANAVGDLSKQYRFLGVAVPGTNPGKILEPTLYVAVAGGWYPGFSNGNVNEGQIVFFTSDDGGAWAASAAYDPQPGGGSQVQSDWNQTDDTQPDYIKNKPNISGGGSAIVECSITEWPVSSSSEAFEGDATICSTLGITIDDLNNIKDGKVLAIRICNLLLPINPYGAGCRGSDPDYPEAFSVEYGATDVVEGYFLLQFGYSNGEAYVNVEALG